MTYLPFKCLPEIVPGKYTNVCDEDRVDTKVSADKDIHITQKEVSETEINAKTYGQGVGLFDLDHPSHSPRSKFPIHE